MANITVVSSLSQLNSLTSASPQKISIIDFHAVWCGPCKTIAPIYQRLATLYSSSTMGFFKVDVDQAKDVAAHFRVTAMPTFLVLRGGAKVEEMKGANPAGLEALVKRYVTSGTSGSGADGASTEKGLEGFAPLNGAIDPTQTTCLNESSDHTIKDLLKGGGDKWLESDADEQLLIHLPIQTSRIYAIKFTTLPSHLSKAPKTVKLFVNNPTLGFDDADSLEPAQELVLTEAQAKGEERVGLRFVRFQKVSTLSIFVVDNQGEEDVTRIDKIELVGNLVDGTDLSQLKKGEHDHEH